MGLGRLTLLFKRGIPTFPEIQSAFFKLTGLSIYLTARLELLTLENKHTNILSLLQQDALSVLQLKREFSNFQQSHPQDYEQLASYRDTIYKKVLSQLNHVANIQLEIPDFYCLDFYVEGNQLEIEWYTNQYYGIVCLKKVLIDLGGKGLNTDQKQEAKRVERWQQLKKWYEYKWYNRPRK